jgi:FkbM family methyltransferase
MDDINTKKLYDKWLKGRKDLVILDIGANIGIFSLHVQDCAKRVLAVEPTPSHFGILKHLTREVVHVEPVNVALSSKNGPIQFHVFPNNTTMNSMVNNYTAGVPLLVKGLDLAGLLTEYNVDHVDFAKIDIEGSEMRSVTPETLAPVFDKIDSIFMEVHITPAYVYHNGKEEPANDVAERMRKIGPDNGLTPEQFQDMYRENMLVMEQRLKQVGYAVDVVDYQSLYAYKV